MTETKTDAKTQNDVLAMQNPAPSRLPVLCLVRDLLFYSKIRAAAEPVKIPLKSVRDPAKLGDQFGCGLIVDLNQENALTAAAQWQQSHGKLVVGFVSHVDAETIQNARSAGIDQVLARSQFEKNLPMLLARLQNDGIH